MYGIIIPIWKRHELTRIVVDYYRKRQLKFGFKLFIAGSEGEISKDIAKCCNYIEVDNFPVSAKNNALARSTIGHDLTGLAIMGSDDLASDEVLQYYRTLDASIPMVYSFHDIYFYRTYTQTLSYWDYGNMGAGRFFTRTLLEAMNYEIWPNELNRGLDDASKKRIEENGYPFKSIYLREINGFIVDVKHDINISSHTIVDISKQVNVEIMARSKAVKKAIESIKSEPKKQDVLKPEIDLTPIKFMSNGTNLGMPKGLYKMDEKGAAFAIKKGWGNIVE